LRACMHMQDVHTFCWQRSRCNVQEALGVGEGEVEVWVVCAIGRKLLAARIDQMRRTVAVTKCAQRTFSAAQWRALLAQLGAWKARPALPRRPGFRAALDAALLQVAHIAGAYILTSSWYLRGSLLPPTHDGSLLIAQLKS